MYAIVHSMETGHKWPAALEKLSQKYEKKWPSDVRIISYSTHVEDSLPHLSQLRPAYTCFVVHFEECTPPFVSTVHRLTRKLDSATPFTDTIWGILTGSNQEDVLFSIQQDSLTIRRVLGGTPVDLSKFETGSWYSEGEACVSYHKRKGEESASKEACPRDTTAVIVQELSAERNIDVGSGVDMIITSGHATENDWNIGYSYLNGQLTCQSGNIMVGRSTDGVLYPITPNGNPKVLSAAGNCLIGSICNSDCMALSWMHCVGVVQMVGYLVPSWYGYGGWGVHKYFMDLPGSLTFSESFFANNQSLVSLLHTKYPLEADKEFDDYRGEDKDCAGLLYDRDMVAFYGDPAFDARLVDKPDQQAYTLTVIELPSDNKWKKYKLKLIVKSNFDRSPIYIFPQTVSRYKLLEGEGTVTCRFVLFTGSYSLGDERHIVYEIQ